MLHCHDMKKGDIFYCEDCGLTLQVLKECDESGDEDVCCCADQETTCIFNCCGTDLKKK